MSLGLSGSFLKDAFGAKCQFEVHGTPRDLDAARDLATRDKYQFQWWAVSLVEARHAVDGFRKALRDGKDPADLRREQRLEAQSDTFAALAKELIEKKRKD